MTWGEGYPPPATTMATSTQPGLLHRALHTPRRTLARRAAFQIHLWAGLLLGLYTAVIGLSGSALVFRDDIERAFRPTLYTLTPLCEACHLDRRQTEGRPQWRDPRSLATNSNQDRQPQRTLDQLLTTATQALPNWQPLGFEQLPTPNPTRPVLLYMVPRPDHPHTAPLSRTPDQLLVYLDPRTGQLLGARSRFAGALGIAANLHYYLLAGDTGYLVNGLAAIAFLTLSLTGWILWWPGLGRIVSAIRIHGLRRTHRGLSRNWKRLNYDLHAVGGFWSNPILLALIVTGLLFVFPQPILRAAAFLTHTDPAAIATWYANPTPPSHPATVPILPIQQAWQRTTATLPPGLTVSYLAIPPDPKTPFEAIAYYPHTAPYAQPFRTFLDPVTGTPLHPLDSRTQPPLLRAALYVYAVHFGSFAGLISRVLWFLTGLMPTVLLTTGVLLWWRRWRHRPA